MTASVFLPWRLTLPAACRSDSSEDISRNPVRKEKSTPASTQEVATSVQSASSGSASRCLIRSIVLPRSSGVRAVDRCSTCVCPNFAAISAAITAALWTVFRISSRGPGASCTHLGSSFRPIGFSRHRNVIRLLSYRLNSLCRSGRTSSAISGWGIESPDNGWSSQYRTSEPEASTQ